MNVENRESPRLTITIPVGFRFPAGPIKEGWGRIVNINTTGIFIETHFRLDAAQVVYVTFTLKHGAHFENLRARVIRVSWEEGYTLAGLAFDAVVDRETLNDVLKSLVLEGGFILSSS